ncbi:MAG: DUF1127 domain-containing protein [Flavobacteriaceae bacterium]
MSVLCDTCDRERVTVPESSADLTQVLVNALQATLAPVAAFYANVQRRRAFRRIADLDPRILDDIGVTPDEVAWANSLPLDANAALELQRVARDRRHVRGVRHR